MSADTPGALPPLPPPASASWRRKPDNGFTSEPRYTADQMRDYALAATAALRARLEASEREVTHWKNVARARKVIAEHRDVLERLKDR